MRKIESVNDFAKAINYIQHEGDNQVVIIVSGETGMGKSVFSIKLARALSKLNGMAWAYNRGMTYSSEQLKNWWLGEADERVPRYSAVIADEFITNAMNVNFMQKKQKELVRLFNIGRKNRNLCLICCIPNFTDLDSKVRKIARFRVELVVKDLKKRIVYGHVLERDENYQARDRWHIDYNFKVLSRGMGNYNRQKGYFGTIGSTPISESDETEYIAYSEEFRTYEEEDEDAGYDELIRQRNIGWLMASQGGHTQTAIAEACGVNHTTVSKALKPLRGRKS